MKLPLYTIDAFTKTPFCGNSAAICLTGYRSLKEEVMQSLAAEMNISETAYVELLSPQDSYKNSDRFKLRWFTPTNEIALCGHATLASASVIFSQCQNENKVVTFSTLSGDLKAKCERDAIILDFPINTPKPVDSHDKWENLISSVLGEKLQKQCEEVLVSETVKKMVVKLQDGCLESDLKSVAPDFSAMMKAHDGSIIKGVIVTMKGQEKYDFISRYFAPWNGINEDPVTGSAHTVLAPFWGQLLKKKRMFARQYSKRGGDLEVNIRDDGRIELIGHATTIVSGSVFIPGF